MGFYLPCHNCALEKLPCARRDQVAAGIKGLGLTAVKFRCAERKPLFAVGQRVFVEWLIPDGDGYYEEVTAERWPATVVAERRPKFQILVDDVDSDYETPARTYIKNESLYAKVTAAKLHPMDEAPRDVCSVCQAVRAGDGAISGCYGYEDGAHGYTPNGCLKFRARQAMETGTAETAGLRAQHDSAVPEGDDASYSPTGTPDGKGGGGGA
jgi:hypothetical protein